MRSETKSLSLDEMLKNYLDNAEVLLSNPIKSAKTIIPLGSALLAGMNAMDAQIFYSGTQNVSCALAGATNRCYANIDLAGGNDFEFHRNHVSAMVFIQVDEVNGGGFDLNGFHGLVTGGYVYPYANAAGVVIGPAGPWGFQAGQANSLSDNGFYPNHKWESLPGGTTRFLGFRGTKTGNTHYGWIRLTKNGFGNYTIVDWAYNQVPNAPIETGQTVSACPTASVISVFGTSSICAGQSANLRVAITGGASPYTVVYSDGTSNFTVNNYISNSNIPVSPTSSKTYTLVSVTDATMCAGTGNSGSAGVNVFQIPTSSVLNLNGPSTICAGQSTNLRVVITGGTGPYSVVYSDGMSNFNVPGYASGANIPVSPTSNKTYSLVSVTDANLCLGSGNSGMPAVAVNPSPTSATLSVNGSSAICAGQTANLKVDIIGGTGPYNLVLNDGTNNIPVNAYTSGANIPVMPLSNTNYSLVSVTDANMCNPASLSGAPAIGVSNGSASAVLSTNGPSTACPGGTINLKVDIMGGVGPYIVVYTDGMTNFNVPGYTSGANIPVMPLMATNYALVSVTDANNCPGTGNSGSVMATVGYATQQDGDYNNPMTWAGGCVPPTTIPMGVTLTILHQVTNTGVITLNGVISSPTGTFINNGTVKGTGTVIGSFINNGTLNPGN